MSAQLKIWLSLLLFALLAYTTYAGMRVYKATHREPPSSDAIEDAPFVGSLADEVLLDSAGKPFALDALKGDVWLASFFFTACPGPCAQMNRAIAGLQQEIPDKNLKFVSITVDPANDTPEVMASYAHGFGADPRRWFFLNCPLEEAQHIGTNVFKVAVGPKMHTERVILIDKRSRVRGYYLTSDPSQMIALKRRIRDLLDDKASSSAAEEDSAANAAPADDLAHPPAGAENEPHPAEAAP